MYHTITENLKYISTEFQDTLPVKLEKRGSWFEDKNKFAKSLLKNKAVFHKDCYAKYNSRNWHGKETYSKKDMKLNKVGLKRLKI